MKKPLKFMPCHFLPYNQVKKASPPQGTLWIDVTSEAEPPYDTLSPFFPHGNIPIPGMSGKCADSVEGIWQGLKVIRGKTAFRYFSGYGKKRGGKPSGHQFGEQKRLLKLEEARRRIYIPSYEWMLENKIEQSLLDNLISSMLEGNKLFFYDFESNGSIGKDLPLAHSSVLASWLNRKVKNYVSSSF